MIFQDDAKAKFVQRVNELVSNDRTTYLDAIITLCEEMDIEPAAVAKHLPKPIVEKLQIEANDLNLLPTSSKLPI